MASVDMSVTLKASAEQVWNAIRGFNALPQWHPAVAKSHEKSEHGKTIRHLTLHGGGEIIEELERQDDEVRAYSYKVIDGPLPVAKYRAELSVHQEDAGKSRVCWQSTFEAKGAPEADAIGVVQAVYQAGFDNLKKMFGS